MVRQLAATRLGVDQKLERARIQLFSGGRALKGVELAEGATADGGEPGYSSEEEEEEEDSGSEEEEDSAGRSGSSSEDEKVSEAGPSGRRALPQQQLVRVADGRLRRRAVFGADALANSGDGGESSSDDRRSASEPEDEGWESEEGEEEQALALGGGFGAVGASDSEEEEEEEGKEGGGSGSEDSEGLGAAAAWKEGMLARASALFSSRGADLTSFIYGMRATYDPSSDMQRWRQEADESDDDGEFFRPKRRAPEALGGRGSGSAAAEDAGAAAQVCHLYVRCCGFELWGPCAVTQSVPWRPHPLAAAFTGCS